MLVARRHEEQVFVIPVVFDEEAVAGEVGPTPVDVVGEDEIGPLRHRHRLGVVLDREVEEEAVVCEVVALAHVERGLVGQRQDLLEPG